MSDEFTVRLLRQISEAYLEYWRNYENEIRQRNYRRATRSAIVPSLRDIGTETCQFQADAGVQANPEMKDEETQTTPAVFHFGVEVTSTMSRMEALEPRPLRPKTVAIPSRRSESNCLPSAYHQS